VNILLKFGELLSEPVNQMISRIFHVFGFGSIVATGARAATEQQIIQQGYGLTEVGAFVAIIGGLLYIPYLILLIALKYRELRGK